MKLLTMLFAGAVGLATLGMTPERAEARPSFYFSAPGFGIYVGPKYKRYKRHYRHRHYGRHHYRGHHYRRHHYRGNRHHYRHRGQKPYWRRGQGF